MLERMDFAARLTQLRTLYPQGDPDMVAEIVRGVLVSMRGDLTVNEAALLAEVEELAQTVASARAEIAALGADDINESHIPSATDELDAIVAHTATATDSILECCEQLDAVGSRLANDDTRILQDVVTRIYEACGFQDITGQRITKVVTTLKAIEAKVAHIIEVFQPENGRAGDKAPLLPTTSEVQETRSPSLLNGPQLPSNAMDQSDIDALLASFD